MRWPWLAQRSKRVVNMNHNRQDKTRQDSVCSHQPASAVKHGTAPGREPLFPHTYRTSNTHSTHTHQPPEHTHTPPGTRAWFLVLGSVPEGNHEPLDHTALGHRRTCMQTWFLVSPALCSPSMLYIPVWVWCLGRGVVCSRGSRCLRVSRTPEPRPLADMRHGTNDRTNEHRSMEQS